MAVNKDDAELESIAENGQSGQDETGLEEGNASASEHEREELADSSEESESEEIAQLTPSAEAPHGSPVPLWSVPLYVAGLVLVYIGERVLGGFEGQSSRWLLSGLGVLSVLVATAVRFSPRFRVGGERRHIEQLLSVLSSTGLIALVLYFITTDAGQARLGLSEMAEDSRETLLDILRIGWIALLFLSVIPMLFAEAALYPMRHAERPESRRVRAAAVAGLALTLSMLYGALFVYSAEHADLKVDYSYFKTSEPSESTRRIAQSLDEPVRIVGFFPQLSPVREEVEGYLRELARGAKNLKVEIYDRLLAPKTAGELRATRDGILVLRKGEQDYTLIVGNDLSEARPKLKTLDRDFQEQLLKHARSRRYAYLTAGHGELNDGGRGSDASRQGSILRTLLNKQNYVPKDLGLAQGLAKEVPEDAAVVLVLGPTEPFSAEELASLRRYAERGGKVFLALDPDAVGGQDFAALVDTQTPQGEILPDAGADAAAATGAAQGIGGDAAPALSAAESARLSSMKELAEIAGVEFSPTVLANERQHVTRRFNKSDRTMLFSNSFSSHASVSTLSRNAPRAAIVLGGTGSLDRLKTSKSKVDFAVRSMHGTFPDKNGDFEQQKDDEKNQLFQLAAAVSGPAVNPEPKQEKAELRQKDPNARKDDPKDKPTPNEMRAFVLADSDALSDLVMGNVVGNQVLFVDALRWLGGEESFAGEVNTEEDVRIEHTKKEDLVWFYATIFGAPALILGLGVAISRRSRRGGKK